MGKTVDTDSNHKSAAKPSKKKFDDALTKVIIRRLPPSFEKDIFLSKLAEIFPDGLPDYDYFKFCGSDLSFSPVSFCRAYINFKNFQDILKFKEKLDGYVFHDGKGGEYPVVVEFSPFQGVPKRTKRRKDIKCGTIEKDSDYLSFLETLNQETEPLPSAEVYLEQQEVNKQNMKDAKITTPLIEYLKMKRTSGKSRNTTQRSSSSSSTANDKKRKQPKENGKATSKNSYSEKSSRGHSANEGSKKGSERKADEFKGSKKGGKDDTEKKRQVNEKKSGKLQNWKEKEGEKEEKEKVVRKERPTSAKSWKENKIQDDQRSGNSASRPSSYRTPRREKASKEPARVSEDVGRNKSEFGLQMKGEKSSEKSEERTSNKQLLDTKERIRNKDRPSQAIYQPRPRSRVDSDDSAVRNSGRHVNKEEKERHSGKSYRDNRSRDRDHRDSSRRQGRDSHKMRSKPEDASTKE